MRSWLVEAILSILLAGAEGGVFPPGWTLVGEKGPELVHFAQTAQVFTAAETAAMLLREPFNKMTQFRSMPPMAPASTSMAEPGSRRAAMSKAMFERTANINMNINAGSAEIARHALSELDWRLASSWS